MTDRLDEEIRSTLGSMVADAPEPMELDQLAMVAAIAAVPRRRWSPAPTIAVAFATVVVVVGAISLGASLLDSDVVPLDEPTVTAPTVALTTVPADATPEAQDVAQSFYGALLSGDWDAANELAQGDLISGPNVNQLWEIEVAGYIRCEDAIDFVVSCTSTQTDALTRQVSDAYAWQSVGRMTVVDGLVTHYTSEDQPDPVFDRYEAWLDDESPDGWLFNECTHGGRGLSVCVPIYLDNVEDWLGTGPDLSEIATAEQTAEQNSSTAEAFYVAYLGGDLASALEMVDGRLSSGLENVNVLWGIEVVGIDCEPLPAGATVTCVATQIDDLTRHISPAYTHRIEAKISVVDGVVTDYEVGIAEADSVLHQYGTWLDVESPDGWLFWECTHGGWGFSECVSIMLANVEAWLATNPDLSEIEG